MKTITITKSWGPHMPGEIEVDDKQAETLERAGYCDPPEKTKRKHRREDDLPPLGEPLEIYEAAEGVGDGT